MKRRLHPKDLLLGATLLALLGALGLVLLGPGATPVEGAATADEPAAPSAAAAEPLVTAPPAALVVEPEPARAESKVTATSGVIRGNIALAADVVRDLHVVYLMVREAVSEISPHGYVPFVRTVKIEIEPHAGTPDFAYDQIPFSAYGYAVRVFAEGVNGSEQYVQVDEQHPVADVMLSITNGVPFSILVRDQHRAPVVEMPVLMVPLGEPTGRPLLQKATDSFGAVVFDRVLQGEYELRTGALEPSRSVPQRVQVLANAGVRSATLEVPYGVELKVQVQAVGGWGIEGAQLTLWQTDTTQFRKHEGKSAYGGEWVFRFLPPGGYQLNVQAEGFQVWSKTVVVRKDGVPEPVTARLVPR